MWGGGTHLHIQQCSLVTLGRTQGWLGAEATLGRAWPGDRGGSCWRRDQLCDQPPQRLPEGKEEARPGGVPSSTSSWGGGLPSECHPRGA